MAVRNQRLLFVCPTCSPVGGLQTWLDQLCAGLESRGWDPVVALVHGPTTNDSSAYKVAHPDLKTIVIDGTAMTMGARVREVMRAVRRVQPEYYIPLTVIDAHDAVCELKRSGSEDLKYVLTVHGNLPQQLLDARIFQPFADVSINPGVLTCRMLEWAGMPPERVFHAPNGIEPREAKPRQESDSILRLAYVGRLTDEDKRVMDLVPLTKALEATGTPYHLDIVGSGPCEALLRKSISTSAVSFHGFVESERLHREYYPGWDVLLMFSQSEAFGLSLIEAMVHGVVPVSSRFVGSQAEGFLIEGETARLFPIGDSTRCAGIIAELHRDRLGLARMSRQTHEYVAARYSWKRCVDEWETALSKCLEFSPRPVPDEAPRPLDEGNSLASRFSWLPPSCSDYFYKSKRRLLGIPEVMKHGEEWPLHTGRWNAANLADIQALTIEMDQRCAG
jgi:glycosyltransferase involved in cell wall biosynthesis